jgi:glycosyltransferase involved in cell wall biosynthesis
VTAISVIICAHNPRAAYLQRVLDALRCQTLPQDQWEVMVIDNASDRVLAKEWDLSWYSLARHVREDELGLTPARLRGIAEARGELLVFVDDDNVLGPNYLENALDIAGEYPFLGTWGGTIRGEFETTPEEWAQPWLGYLGLREISAPSWSNNPDDGWAHPCGAGLCVRRVVAKAYVEQVSGSPGRRRLDRVGQTLSSGGDYDLIETSCDVGMGFGNFPSLEMTHLIPDYRIRKGYLIRLVQGCTISGVVLRYLRSGSLPPEPSRIRVAARYLLNCITRGRRQAQIIKAQQDALRKGIKIAQRLDSCRASGRGTFAEMSSERAISERVSRSTQSAPKQEAAAS